MKNTLHTKLLMSSALLAVTLNSSAWSQELELKSISNQESYRLARICFLPDCSENVFSEPNGNINIESNWCEKNGYASGCPDKTSPLPGSDCPRDTSYKKCSAKQWCTDNGYIYDSCLSPKILNGELCQGAAKSCVCSSEYTVDKCAAPLLMSDEKCDGKAKSCYCPEKYKYTTDNDCPAGQIIDSSSEKCLTPTNIAKYSSCKNKCPDSYVSCSGFYEGVGTACNGKYAACAYRPENIVCGSYSIPAGSSYSKVVTNCSELLNTVNSGITGNIVINGKLSCGDRSLNLKAGQNLIGFGYFYNTDYDNYNNEINNCSSISFTNPTGKYAIAPRSSMISHVNLTLDNTTGADKFLLYPMDNSVTLTNVDLKVNGQRSFAVTGSSYSGEGSGQKIEIKKIVNIKSDKPARTFAANVIDTYVRGDAVLNINNIEEPFSSASLYTFDNTKVNIRTASCSQSACFIIWNTRPSFQDNSEINIIASGGTGIFGDSYPSTSGNVKLNVERQSGCLACRHIYGANASWGAGTIMSLPEGTYQVNSSCSGTGNTPCGSTRISAERPNQNADFKQIFSSGIFGG